MTSFKKFFFQQKFEEEIEIDVEDHSGAVYKIPLGSTYQGPINREGFEDSYIIVDISDENEEGELIEPEKLGIFKFFFEIHIEKDDEGTTELQSIFEPDEVVHIFNELKNTIFMFKKFIENEGKEFKGFSFEISKKGKKGEEVKRIYEKMFGVLKGNLEEVSPNKFIFRLEQ